MKLFTIAFLSFVNIAVSQEVAIPEKTNHLPELENFINDFENIFLLHQENILEASVKSFYQKTEIGITIVTIESIEPYENFFDYSVDLAAKSNRGKILIAVSKKLRTIRIQNSDDILDKLTNEETQAIIDNYILPEFKKDNYFKGLHKGLAEIRKELY